MKAGFSIPFNGDLALVKKALASGRVAEVYFALPGRGGGASGHFVKVKGAPVSEAGSIAALAALCSRSGAGLNLLCNSPSLAGLDLAPVFAAARALGVTSVTLADPLFIAAFREALPEVRLQASVIMNINSVERARQVFAAGVRTLTPAAEASRNLDLLLGFKRLKSGFPGARIKLMANYYCGYDCAYMTAHYFSALLPRGSAPRGPGGACYYRSAAEYERLKRPFIRPEDTGFYERRGLADEFKLIARYQPSAALRKIYAAYFTGSFSGDLNELMGGRAGNYGKKRPCRMDNSRFPGGFVLRTATCDKDCAACGYCRRVFAAVTGGRRSK